MRGAADALTQCPPTHALPNVRAHEATYMVLFFFISGHLWKQEVKTSIQVLQKQPERS